jgi:hypothetical protein
MPFFYGIRERRCFDWWRAFLEKTSTMVNKSALLSAAVAASTALASAETIVVSLRHNTAKIEALAELVDEIADPRSSQYGKWLTSEDLEKYVKASDTIVAAVKQWVEKENKVCKAVSLGHNSQHQNGDNNALEFQLTGQGDFLEVTGLERACIHRLISIWEVEAHELCEGIFFKDAHSSTLKITKNEAEKDAAAEFHSSIIKFARKKGNDTIANVGSPPEQKDAYGIPSDVTGNAENNLQMVWGPGTFGYLESDLEEFYTEFDVANADINTVSVK